MGGGVGVGGAGGGGVGAAGVGAEGWFTQHISLAVGQMPFFCGSDAGLFGDIREDPQPRNTGANIFWCSPCWHTVAKFAIERAAVDACA